MIEGKSVAGIDLTTVEGKSIVEYLRRVPALQLHCLKPGLALLNNYQSSYESQPFTIAVSLGFLALGQQDKCHTLLGREQKVWWPP
jgi:hypothetical protein